VATRPFWIFLAVFAAWGWCAPAEAAEWRLIKHEGRDYVTAQNIAQFYGMGDVIRAKGDFTVASGRRSLRGQVGSAEFYINNLKFILSYPVAESGGQPILSRMDLTKLIEPVMRPSRIEGVEQARTVILDPGHGGTDFGARSRWGSEKSFTLDVALRAKEQLKKEGLRVYLTRTSDQFVSLHDRVKFANQFQNAVFVSIHFNSGGSHASGLETYTLAPRGVPSMAADGPRITDLQPCPGHANDPENMALATATHAAMVAHSGMYDRGIKRARFVVIRDITVPGVLVEGGFLSNPSDSRRIATASYRQGMATWISAAIRNYRRAVGGPGATPSNTTVALRDPVPSESPSGASPGGGPVVETGSPN
jgi:N-acetylmuramoyl-L-alanine amidase